MLHLRHEDAACGQLLRLRGLRQHQRLQLRGLIPIGQNNKARRAAKAKQRAARGTPRSRGQRGGNDAENDFWFGPEQQVASLWFELHLAARKERPDLADVGAKMAAHPAPVVDAQGELLVRDILESLWAAGWQPVELRRHVRRSCPAVSARLVESAILADHDRRVGQRIDERWAAQLHEFPQREVPTRGSWLATWRQREGLDRADGYVAAAQAVAVLSGLPPLDVLIPPPGAPALAAGYGLPAASGRSGDPVLARIRKLLAKAESTEFEEEAAALTAKAQGLMTRHAIDQALVDAPDDHDVPRMMRLPVDAPYADAKSLLLAVVAEANRCRAVYLTGLEMSSVAGHTGDLSLVELLFTSLLVQAQNALTEAARPDGFGRRARSQSFRSSFFVAYAHRIRERLSEVNEQVFAEAEDSVAFLPVLRSRADAVEEFMAERFGDALDQVSVRGGYDYVGSAVGRRAADEAEFASGELLW